MNFACSCERPDALRSLHHNLMLMLKNSSDRVDNQDFFSLLFRMPLYVMYFSFLRVFIFCLTS